MKVTIRDIAKIAGVSHSTVSRSLNDHPSISASRRDQIKKIARELGFEYNAIAKRLRGGKVGTVGVIAKRNMATTFFMDTLIMKITHEQENSFLDYIVSFPEDSQQGANNIRRLVSAGKVDGFILLNPDITFEDYDFLSSQDIPFVLLHFKPQTFAYDNLNYFVTDHEYGAYIATNHLIDLGRRNIVSVSEGGGDAQFLERSAGFKRSLAEHDLAFTDEMLTEGECSFEYGRQYVLQRKNILHKIDGIFAQADVIALGVIDALKELGVRVPEDISVVGYDDIQIGEYSSPRLTTVHQPTEDMDHQACLRINELINESQESDPVQKIFKPGLVIRDSCTPGTQTE